MDYVDLLLLHWPVDNETNKKGVDLLNQVLHKQYAKNVGVSNFNLSQLERAVAKAPICCNQVEYHPYLSQDKMLSFLRKHKLFMTGYRPLAKGKVMEDATLIELGKKYARTPGQIALRWLVQQDNITVIPKASSIERIKENLAIFDFELSEEDMQRLFSLPKDLRITDPEWGPKWD